MSLHRLTASHIGAVVADIGPRHGRRGGFVHPGMLVIGLMLLGALAAGLYLLFRGNRSATPSFAGHPTPMGPPPGPAPWSPTASAEVILAERFARGEMSVDDFVAARSALRGEWPAATSPVTPATAAPTATTITDPADPSSSTPG